MIVCIILGSNQLASSNSAENGAAIGAFVVFIWTFREVMSPRGHVPTHATESGQDSVVFISRDDCCHQFYCADLHVLYNITKGFSVLEMHESSVCVYIHRYVSWCLDARRLTLLVTESLSTSTPCPAAISVISSPIITQYHHHYHLSGIRQSHLEFLPWFRTLRRSPGVGLQYHPYLLLMRANEQFLPRNPPEHFIAIMLREV